MGIYPKWAETTTFYEIFVRSFADSNGDGVGDFKGIEENIDYLKELGVGAIWLMPMMDSTTYHGYDVTDYYATNPDYGTMEDFDSLVAACHENGIKVILDFVVNHTSSGNEWFKEALADENSKYRDYYFIEESIPVKEDDPTYSAWKQDADTGLYYYGHYDVIMPDLNYHNQEVRDEIKNVAKFWLEHGIDGFRLDGSKEIDTDIEVTLDWWQEFTVTIRLTVPENTPDEPIYIIGSFNNWAVADSACVMTKVGDYTYEYVMTGLELSSIEYKYNCGNWSAREQNADHVDLVGSLQKENREYTYLEDNYVVEDVIESWSDIK